MVTEQKYRGQQVALYTDSEPLFYEASEGMPRGLARVSLGQTFNTGDYTSLRLEVSYEIPCDPHRLGEAEAYLWQKAKDTLKARSKELL